MDKSKIDISHYLIKAFEKRSSKFFRELERCKAEFSEAPVHDLRVAIRRLMSIVLLIDKFYSSPYFSELSRELKSLLKMLSPLRDTQVQILTIQNLIYLFPNLYHFNISLLKTEKKLIKSISRALISFNTDNFKGLSFFYYLDIRRKLDNYPIETSVLYELMMAEYMCVKSAMDMVDSSVMPTIHAVRLAFKRFRYILEIIQPLLKPIKGANKKMDAIQTELGLIQDSFVLLKNLFYFSIEQKKLPQSSFYGILSYLKERQDIQIENFINSFDEFQEIQEYFQL
jgi:CHAD domain-containing protein